MILILLRNWMQSALPLKTFTQIFLGSTPSCQTFQKLPQEFSSLFRILLVSKHLRKEASNAFFGCTAHQQWIPKCYGYTWSTIVTLWHLSLLEWNKNRNIATYNKTYISCKNYRQRKKKSSTSFYNFRAPLPCFSFENITIFHPCSWCLTFCELLLACRGVVFYLTRSMQEKIGSLIITVM